jgi:glycosyltransferase involved in cell wall biosynthesis
MRICMFVRNPITADPRVRHEAEHLAAAGHEVTVIGTPGEGLPAAETVAGVRYRRVGRLADATIRAFRRIKASPAPAPAAAGRPAGRVAADAGWAFRQAVRLSEWTWRATWVAAGKRVAADVYHAHDFNTLAIAAACARRRGARLVYDSHELWIEWHAAVGGLPPDVAAMWSAAEARLARQADLVVTVSDGIADELARAYGIGRPLVVRNCAPTGDIVRTDKLRRLIGAPPNRPVLLAQGGYVPGRGLEQIAAAAALVPSAEFVFIGQDWPYKASIERLADDAPHGNVHVLPYVPLEDLWELTCGADAGFVLTEPVCLSYELSESNKVYEYLAAGIPAVASGIVNHRRLAAETGALALVDPVDEATVARVVNELLSDPQRMRQMGAAGRHWAERKYNVAAEMTRLQAAYEALGAR